MTLSQFVATGRFVKDLRSHPMLDFWDGYWDDAPETPQGMVYLGFLVIELVMPTWPAETQAKGRWCLVIGNGDYVSDNLSLLERQLHVYAQDEGLCPREEHHEENNHGSDGSCTADP